MKMYKDGIEVEAMACQLEALTDAGWSTDDLPRDVEVVYASDVPPIVEEPLAGTRRKFNK